VKCLDTIASRRDTKRSNLPRFIPLAGPCTRSFSSFFALFPFVTQWDSSIFRRCPIQNLFGLPKSRLHPLRPFPPILVAAAEPESHRRSHLDHSDDSLPHALSCLPQIIRPPHLPVARPYGLLLRRLSTAWVQHSREPPRLAALEVPTMAYPKTSFALQAGSARTPSLLPSLLYNPRR
jgi:hypothetical protein